MLTALEVRALTVLKWQRQTGGALSRQEVSRLLFVRWLMWQGRISEGGQ